MGGVRRGVRPGSTAMRFAALVALALCSWTDDQFVGTSSGTGSHLVRLECLSCYPSNETYQTVADTPIKRSLYNQGGIEQTLLWPGALAFLVEFCLFT